MRLAAAALLLAGAARAQSTSRGSIVGFVTDKPTGAPLAYADVLVEGARTAAFVDASGRFRADGLPPGEIHVRVRSLGFTPATVTATVHGGATDTLRIALSRIAIQLERVSVRDKVCPDGGTTDTAVVAILQQVQMNADRAALLARQMPFDSEIERVAGDETALRPVAGVKPNRRVTIDTISLPSVHDWEYAPGNLVEIPADQDERGRAQMKLPQLTDFASPRFVAAHCFRYAGVRELDRQRLIQVEVEPTKDVKTPDIKGALYLDPSTYHIVRSALRLEMPSPANPLDSWETHVDTWFREILPAMPVIDRVCMRMTVRTQRGKAPDASAEAQRLLALRFLNDEPPGLMAIQPAAVDSSRRSACPTS